MYFAAVSEYMILGSRFLTGESRGNVHKRKIAHLQQIFADTHSKLTAST